MSSLYIIPKVHLFSPTCRNFLRWGAFCIFLFNKDHTLANILSQLSDQINLCFASHSLSFKLLQRAMKDVKLEQRETVCSHFSSIFPCCCMIFIRVVIRLTCRETTEIFSHLIKAFKFLGWSSLAMQKKIKKPQHPVYKKRKHKANHLIYVGSPLSKI